MEVKNKRQKKNQIGELLIILKRKKSTKQHYNNNPRGVTVTFLSSQTKSWCLVISALWKFLQPSLPNGPLGKQNTETTTVRVVCCRGREHGCYVRKKNLPLPLELEGSPPQVQMIGLLIVRDCCICFERVKCSFSSNFATDQRTTNIYSVYMLLNR